MQAEPITLSTTQVIDKNRDEIIREYYGKIAMRMEITPSTPEPAKIEATTFVMPGVTATHGLISALSGRRTKLLRADGASDIFLSFPRNGMLLSEDGRDDIFVRPGAMVLSSLDRMSGLAVRDEENLNLSLQIPRQALSPLVNGIDDLLVGSLEGLPVLNLLKTYTSSLFQPQALSNRMREVAAKHLIELVALALGPTRDGQEVALDGGVRGARLLAAKNFIMANLDSPHMSAGTVAAHLGISPRYLHMLFGAEELTPTEFITQQRLIRAMGVLTDPRQHHRRIADIALAAGFNDLRTFNRAFKRQFDKTPTDARAEGDDRG